MRPLLWVALALAVLAWPVSVRTTRMRALVQSGRLLEPRSAPTRGAAGPAPSAGMAVVAGLGSGALAGVFAGARLAVTIGLVVSITGSAGAAMLRTAARERRGRQRRDRLQLALTVLAGELSAGSSPDRARTAAAEAVPELAVELSAMTPDGDGVGSLAAAWQISELTGAALSELLARVRADVEAERSVDRAVLAAVAGPRSSAALLALLPLLGIGLGVAIGADPLSTLLFSPGGNALLVLGVLFDALGVLWASTIIRRAQPRAPA